MELKENGSFRSRDLNLIHKILSNSQGEGKIPGKMLVESTSAIFNTLQRGIPNFFPGIFPSP
jgi:hypothetical protein